MQASTGRLPCLSLVVCLPGAMFSSFFILLNK